MTTKTVEDVQYVVVLLFSFLPCCLLAFFLVYLVESMEYMMEKHGFIVRRIY